MLNGTQTIYSKNDDKTLRFHKVIPAVFYDFGADDEMVENDNSVKTVDENKKPSVSVLKYKSPVYWKTVDGKEVEVKSSVDPDLLFSEAVQDIQTNFPGSNPILKILAYATEGRNAEIKRENTPVKEMDEDAGIKKMVANLLKMFPTMGESAALIAAKAAVEAGKAAAATAA